jgi:hypothetical protein
VTPVVATGIRCSTLSGIADFVTHTFDIAASAANGVAGGQEAKAKQKQQRNQWAFHG